MDPIRGYGFNQPAPQVIGGFEPIPDERPVQPQAPNTDAAENRLPDAQQETASSLTKRLKTMIENAAERNIASLDAQTLRQNTATILADLKHKINNLKWKFSSTARAQRNQLKQQYAAMSKDMNPLCDRAQKTFAALGKLKGADIGEAFSYGALTWVDAKTDKKGKVIAPHYEFGLLMPLPDRDKAKRLEAIGKTVTDALNAQQALGDHLETLYRKTGGAYDSLYAMSTASLARATEIDSLATELANLSEKLKEGGKDADEGSALLNLKAARLLPQRAIEMHGNDMTLDLLNTSLAPIAKALDTMKRHLADGAEASPINANAIRDLQLQLTEASKALERAGRDGISYGESEKFIPEASVMDAVRSHLDKLQNDLTMLSQKAIQTSAQRLVDDLIPDLQQQIRLDGTDKSLFDALKALNKNEKADIHEALNFFSEIAEQTKRHFEECITGKMQIEATIFKLKIIFAQNSDHVNGLGHTLWTLSQAANFLRNKPIDDLRMDNEDRAKIRGFCNQLENDAHLKDKLFELIDRGGFAPYIQTHAMKGDDIVPALELIKARLEVMQQKFKQQDPSLLVDDKLLVGLMNGDFGADTYAGVKSWNLPDEMINPHLDDTSLVNSKPLGSGAVNTVFLCNYRMPGGGESSYVFKPELLGRVGLDHMTLSMGGGPKNQTYDRTQTVAQLNFASRKVAQMLGADHLIPKAYAGMHDGHFGLFMSVAPGKSPYNLFRSAENGDWNTTAPDSTTRAFQNLANPAKIKSKERMTLIGTLARETSELEWCDLISGQGDRHGSNYNVSVNENYEASVTGIDNDASFHDWRLGAQHFIASGVHANQFAQYVLEKIEINLQADNLQRNVWLEDLPFVKVLESGGYEIDFERKFDLPVPKHGKSLQTENEYRSFAAHVCNDCFGIKKATIPKFISRNTFDKLKILGEMTDDALKSHYRNLLGIKLTDLQLDACVSRTRDAWRHAQRLQESQRVKSDNDWVSETTYKQVREDLLKADQDGKTAKKIMQSFLESDILCPLSKFSNIDCLLPELSPVNSSNRSDRQS